MATSNFRSEVKTRSFRACVMNDYNPYYMNCSVIADSAMGQTPRSTERISSYFFYIYTKLTETC